MIIPSHEELILLCYNCWWKLFCPLCPVVLLALLLLYCHCPHAPIGIGFPIVPISPQACSVLSLPDTLWQQQSITIVSNGITLSCHVRACCCLVIVMKVEKKAENPSVMHCLAFKRCIQLCWCLFWQIVVLPLL